MVLCQHSILLPLRLASYHEIRAERFRCALNCPTFRVGGRTGSTLAQCDLRYERYEQYRNRQDYGPYEERFGGGRSEGGLDGRCNRGDCLLYLSRGKFQALELSSDSGNRFGADERLRADVPKECAELRTRFDLRRQLGLVLAHEAVVDD